MCHAARAQIPAELTTRVTTASKTGKAIRVGKTPVYIAITPNGKTAYVANWESATVTPIRTATNKAIKAIKAGTGVMGPPPPHRNHAER